MLLGYRFVWKPGHLIPVLHCSDVFYVKTYFYVPYLMALEQIITNAHHKSNIGALTHNLPWRLGYHERMRFLKYNFSRIVSAASCLPVQSNGFVIFLRSDLYRNENSWKCTKTNMNIATTENKREIINGDLHKGFWMRNRCRSGIRIKRPLCLHTVSIRTRAACCAAWQCSGTVRGIKSSSSLSPMPRFRFAHLLRLPVKCERRTLAPSALHARASRSLYFFSDPHQNRAFDKSSSSAVRIVCRVVLTRDHIESGSGTAADPVNSV